MTETAVAHDHNDGGVCDPGCPAWGGRSNLDRFDADARAEVFRPQEPQAPFWERAAAYARRRMP